MISSTPNQGTSDHGITGDHETVVVFSSVVSLSIALVYCVMRSGFQNPLGPIAATVGLSLFQIGFPYAGRSLAEATDRPLEHWYGSYPFLWLVGIVLSGILGWLTPRVGLNPMPLLALVGVTAFLLAFVRWLRLRGALRSVVFLAGFALFGVWAAGVVWGRLYKSPIFLEMLIADGKVHHDGLSLAALAGMLRTYGVASMGVDGLPYLPYHWGSAWLFAQWVNLTETTVLSFYQLGYAVTVIPFFFGALLAFAVELRRARNGAEAFLRHPLTWGVFLVGCIGFLPLAGLDAMGVWTSNYLISESYAIAIPCALMVAATAFIFHRSRRTAGGDFARLGPLEGFFALIFLPVAIVVLGYLKISVMILGYVVVLYLILRIRVYHRPLYFIGAAILTIGVIIAYVQVSLPAHREGIAPFDFLTGYVSRPWWPFFVLVHLLWVWIYAVVRIRQAGLQTLGDIGQAIRAKQIVDVEAVVVLGLVGLLPGLALHIDGGSAFYFSDVQRWLALALVLSVIPVASSESSLVDPSQARPASANRGGVSRISARTVLIVFVLIPVAAAVVENAAYWPLRMVRANVETRRTLYPARLASAIPAGVHGFRYLRDPSLLAMGLRASSRYPVVAFLTGISRAPIDERRRTALFIPQDDERYWTILSRPGACSFQSLVAPALSEHVMLDGMPAFGCPVSRYYGMGSYPPRKRAQLSTDTTDIVLCARATRWGLDRVLLVRFTDGPARSRLVRCSSS